MSNLREKMNNYEVTPPANAWNRIADALDEAYQGDQFPARLYAMEVAPPAAAWDKLTASLGETNTPGQAIVIDRSSRFKQMIRYAAAAVVIAAVAFGILKWTGASYQESTGPAVAGVTNDSGNATTNVQNTGSAIASAPLVPADVVDQKKSASPEKLIAKLDRPYRTAARKVSTDAHNASYTSSPMSVKPRAIYVYNDHVPSMADRYIMLMTPDGNFIRMSKKLGNLVCCVSGEDPDADCKDQLKKWQEKMATSSLTTSAGNFIDILQLVNSLDEGAEL